MRERKEKRPVLNIYLIGSKSHQEGSYRVFEPSELEDPDNNLELLGSDIIIIGSDAYYRIAEFLPPYAEFRSGRYELSSSTTSRIKRLEDLPRYSNCRLPRGLLTKMNLIMIGRMKYLGASIAPMN